MSSTATLGSTVQKGVARMLTEGSALSDIEVLIERQPIDEQQEAALWLWAWPSNRSQRPDCQAAPDGRLALGT